MKRKNKQKKPHCYGEIVIFSQVCLDDDCEWYVPCKIMCGNSVGIFEYELVGLIEDILTWTEITEILMKNYGISKNASKMAIKRYNKKNAR